MKEKAELFLLSYAAYCLTCMAVAAQSTPEFFLICDNLPQLLQPKRHPDQALSYQIIVSAWLGGRLAGETPKLFNPKAELFLPGNQLKKGALALVELGSLIEAVNVLGYEGYSCKTVLDYNLDAIPPLVVDGTL